MVHTANGAKNIRTKNVTKLAKSIKLNSSSYNNIAITINTVIC